MLCFEQEEVTIAKEEWELSRLQALKEEDELRAELEEDEMLFTYARDDAYSQVKKGKKGAKHNNQTKAARRERISAISCAEGIMDREVRLLREKEQAVSAREEKLWRKSVKAERIKNENNNKSVIIKSESGSSPEVEVVKKVSKINKRRSSLNSISSECSVSSIGSTKRMRLSLERCDGYSGSESSKHSIKKSHKNHEFAKKKVVDSIRNKARKNALGDSKVSPKMEGVKSRISPKQKVSPKIASKQKLSPKVPSSRARPALASPKAAIPVPPPWSNPNLVIRTRRASIQSPPSGEKTDVDSAVLTPTKVTRPFAMASTPIVSAPLPVCALESVSPVAIPSSPKIRNKSPVVDLLDANKKVTAGTYVIVNQGHNALGQTLCLSSPQATLSGNQVKYVTATNLAQHSVIQGVKQLTTPAQGVKQLITPAQGVKQLITPAQGVKQLITPAQGVKQLITPAQGVKHITALQRQGVKQLTLLPQGVKPMTSLQQGVKQVTLQHGMKQLTSLQHGMKQVTSVPQSVLQNQVISTLPTQTNVRQTTPVKQTVNATQVTQPQVIIRQAQPETRPQIVQLKQLPQTSDGRVAHVRTVRQVTPSQLAQLRALGHFKPGQHLAVRAYNPNSQQVQLRTVAPGQPIQIRQLLQGQQVIRTTAVAGQAVLQGQQIVRTIAPTGQAVLQGQQIVRTTAPTGQVVQQGQQIFRTAAPTGQTVQQTQQIIRTTNAAGQTVHVRTLQPGQQLITTTGQPIQVTKTVGGTTQYILQQPAQGVKPSQLQQLVVSPQQNVVKTSVQQLQASQLAQLRAAMQQARNQLRPVAQQSIKVSHGQDVLAVPTVAGSPQKVQSVLHTPVRAVQTLQKPTVQTPVCMVQTTQKPVQSNHTVPILEKFAMQLSGGTSSLVSSPVSSSIQAVTKSNPLLHTRPLQVLKTSNLVPLSLGQVSLSNTVLNRTAVASRTSQANQIVVQQLSKPVVMSQINGQNR